MIAIVCYTAGILYLFFNFELIIKEMELDVLAISGVGSNRSINRGFQPQI